MSLTAELPVFLRDQGTDDNNDGDGRVRRDRGLGNDEGGVGRGQGIYNLSKESDTTTEAAGARRRPRGMYDNDRGVGGVR